MMLRVMCFFMALNLLLWRWFLLCRLEAVAQGHDTVVNAGILGIGRKEAGADELELLAGLCICQRLFQLAALACNDAVGVQIILVVAAVRDGVHVGFGEELVVQTDFSLDTVGGTDPVDGTLDLAAVDGVAVAGLEVGGAVDGCDAAVGVLLDALALDDISTHQTDFAADGQTLELGRRHLGKVLVLDPQLTGKGDFTGGGIVCLTVGVVGNVEILGLVLRVVVDDEFDRVEDGDTPLCGQVQLAADAGFQLAHVDEVVRLGDAGLTDEGEDGGRGVTTAAQTAQGRHTGIIPAVDDAHLDQLTQITLAHDGVGHIQTCELALLRELGAKDVLDDPVVQRTMVLELKAAHAVGNALDSVLNGVCEVVHRVDAPLVALTVMLGVLNTVDGRVTHVHVGACEVDLCTQGLLALLELTSTHPAEQVEVLLGRAVTPRRWTGRLAGVVAAVLAHLVPAQVVNVCLALIDELLGVLIALVKVVAAVEDAAGGICAQPVQVFDDAVDILLAFTGRVGVVQTKIELAAVLVRDGPVDVDGLRAADVQVAVRLRRKTGMDLADIALGEVGVDDLGQKVFICHGGFPPIRAYLPGIYTFTNTEYFTPFFALLQGGNVNFQADSSETPVFCASGIDESLKKRYNTKVSNITGCCAVGSAPALGAGGREFESRHSDQKLHVDSR